MHENGHFYNSVFYQGSENAIQRKETSHQPAKSSSSWRGEKVVGHLKSENSAK